MDTEPVIPKSLQLYTAEQSRNIDRQTIDQFGIDGFTLMELAAQGASAYIRKLAGNGKTGLFICGKGNNAGDALAVARLLHENASHRVNIYYLFGDSGLSADANRNHELLNELKRHGASVEFISELSNNIIEASDYMVDGIFGTGLSSEVRSPADSIIHKINRAGRPVYAMDIPSGIHPDTGEPMGTAIRATHTFTFGTQKIGLYLNTADTYTGRIRYIDLPFPFYLRKDFITSITPGLEPALPKVQRSADHKYQDGVVHLVAGSRGLTGAAIMAAKSAWKQGAGAVLLYTPEELLPIYETALPQTIKIVLKGENRYVSKHVRPVLKKMQEKPGVLLIGPGAGTDPSTLDFITELLSSYDGPAVIDADALACWDKIREFDSTKRENWILTPHPGEAKRYLKLKFDDNSSRLNESKKFAETHHISLLMKGNPTCYIHSDGQTFITGYNTAPFSRAGFGDQLAGTISAVWGITGSAVWSPVYALLHGYKTLKQLDHSSIFGPEHLI